MKDKKTLFKYIAGFSLLGIILSSVFAGGYLAGKAEGQDMAAAKQVKALAYSDTEEVATSTEENLDFNLYWEVWDRLKSNYVDRNKVSNRDLFYGSLKGLAAATGDPYTVFMDPKEAKEFTDDLAGTFEGIGAEIGIRNEIATIVAPLDGMPAQKAGLLAGDKVYAVDGVSTLGLSVDEVDRKSVV